MTSYANTKMKSGIHHDIREKDDTTVGENNFSDDDRRRQIKIYALLTGRAIDNVTNNR
jgi:hypothetical protein